MPVKEARRSEGKYLNRPYAPSVDGYALYTSPRVQANEGATVWIFNINDPSCIKKLTDGCNEVGSTNGLGHKTFQINDGRILIPDLFGSGMKTMTITDINDPAAYNRATIEQHYDSAGSRRFRTYAYDNVNDRVYFVETEANFFAGLNEYGYLSDLGNPNWTKNVIINNWSTDHMSQFLIDPVGGDIYVRDDQVIERWDITTGLPHLTPDSFTVPAPSIDILEGWTIHNGYVYWISNEDFDVIALWRAELGDLSTSTRLYTITGGVPVGGFGDQSVEWNNMFGLGGFLYGNNANNPSRWERIKISTGETTHMGDVQDAVQGYVGHISFSETNNCDADDPQEGEIPCPDACGADLSGNICYSGVLRVDYFGHYLALSDINGNDKSLISVPLQGQLKEVHNPEYISSIDRLALFSGGSLLYTVCADGSEYIQRFSSGTIAEIPTGLKLPQCMEYDSANDRLYINVISGENNLNTSFGYLDDLNLPTWTYNHISASTEGFKDFALDIAGDKMFTVVGTGWDPAGVYYATIVRWDNLSAPTKTDQSPLSLRDNGFALWGGIAYDPVSNYVYISGANSNVRSGPFVEQFIWRASGNDLSSFEEIVKLEPPDEATFNRFSGLQYYNGNIYALVSEAKNPADGKADYDVSVYRWDANTLAQTLAGGTSLGVYQSYASSYPPSGSLIDGFGFGVRVNL